ncbi:hypothetical protein WG66_015354 [Moniliophthora roreri]|uniref:MARVEL domain-containing protein n=1 Tax=Moniliophthora roreri TaxID=221103 RepID=A0A0W0G3I6_MONRR|nr:hypothetical protein WG66_015354 [Moniliophthora roreri]
MLPLTVHDFDYDYDYNKKHRLSRRKRKFKRMSSSFVTGHYHPLLFALMTLSAAAELGLAAFIVSVGNESGMWDSTKYHALLILFLFNSSWTLLFSTAYMMYVFDGGARFLADVASSVMWLLLTGVLWGTGAGILHNTRVGGDCAGTPSISPCRQSLTVEALGWAEFGLCTLNLLLTCAWIISNRRSKLTGDSRRMV